MITGIKIFSIKNILDQRGLFREVYKNKDQLTFNLIQENESVSHYGVFRGMHFQKDQYVQNYHLNMVLDRIFFHHFS